jgi:hypothetical protein
MGNFENGLDGLERDDEPKKINTIADVSAKKEIKEQYIITQTKEEIQKFNSTFA